MSQDELGRCEQLATNIRGKRWSKRHGEGVPEELGRRSICLVRGLCGGVSLCLAEWWRTLYFPTAAKQRGHILHVKNGILTWR